MQKIVTHLWFENHAEEAVNFYTSYSIILKFYKCHIMMKQLQYPLECQYERL